jgi:hypothetical protein
MNLICHYLDHAEKCCRFNLATAIHDAGVDFHALNNTTSDDGEDGEGSVEYGTFDSTASLLSIINPISPLIGTRTNTDYFQLATDL